MPEPIIASDKAPSKLYFDLVVLKTESKEDFAKLVEELNQEIKPASFIERMYVADVAYLIWEIIRLRRVKVATINNAFEAAVKNILKQILLTPAFGPHIELVARTEQLARNWFLTKQARDRVLGLLQAAGLDESSIEAEAFRLRIDDIEKLDRALTLAEARRDKALRMVAEYKESFAMWLQQGAERVLAVGNVPSLEYQLPEN